MPPYCEKHQCYWSKDNNDRDLRCEQCHEEALRRVYVSRYDRNREQFKADHVERLQACLCEVVRQAGGRVRVSAVAMEARPAPRVATAFDPATSEYVLSSPASVRDASEEQG